MPDQQDEAECLTIEMTAGRRHGRTLRQMQELMRTIVNSPGIQLARRDFDDLMRRAFSVPAMEVCGIQFPPRIEIPRGSPISCNKSDLIPLIRRGGEFAAEAAEILNNRFGRGDKQYYAESVRERYAKCSDQEFLEGYYLGLNPNPNDDSVSIAKWDAYP